MCLRFQSIALRLFTTVALLFVIASHAIAQSPTPFVPKEFKVPEKLETQEFRLRMLTVNDIVKDYDAVMTSVEHLKTIWPGGSWPEGLTFEQDLIDLGWHQKEFQRRTSFAYTVVTPSESKVTGCVYINPTPKRGYDAAVYLWARQSELEGGLESRLLSAVKEWLAKEMAVPESSLSRSRHQLGGLAENTRRKAVMRSAIMLWLQVVQSANRL